MADNFAFTPGVGASGAADEIDGVLYPRVKMIIGANNTNDGDISSANPLPVTGTVTANLSATDNTVLDNIDADLTTVIGHVDGIEALLTTIDADTSKIPSQGQALAAASMPVVLPADQITTLTPPAAITGFATSAKQDTLIGHVDGVETLLGTIDADTSTLASAVAGTEYQVDVVAALPAGTNTIGKVAPNEYELAGNTTHVKKYYTSAGAATDGIVWSPAAGKRWYVTDIFIQVSAAATVTLEDDLTAGDSTVWKAELAANSGWSHSFTTPLFSGEDAADLLITTTAGNVYVTVTGYEI